MGVFDTIYALAAKPFEMISSSDSKPKTEEGTRNSESPEEPVTDSYENGSPLQDYRCLLAKPTPKSSDNQHDIPHPEEDTNYDAKDGKQIRIVRNNNTNQISFYHPYDKSLAYNGTTYHSSVIDRACSNGTIDHYVKDRYTPLETPEQTKQAEPTKVAQNNQPDNK